MQIADTQWVSALGGFWQLWVQKGTRFSSVTYLLVIFTFRCKSHAYNYTHTHTPHHTLLYVWDLHTRIITHAHTHTPHTTVCVGSSRIIKPPFATVRAASWRSDANHTRIITHAHTHTPHTTVCLGSSRIIKPPFATVRAASCKGPVHLFVCLSFCLSVAKMQKRYVLKNQVALLSQKGRAMLRVIEYFAKSLKVTQDHSKWHCWVGRV